MDRLTRSLALGAVLALLSVTLATAKGAPPKITMAALFTWSVHLVPAANG